MTIVFFHYSFRDAKLRPQSRLGGRRIIATMPEPANPPLPQPASTPKPKPKRSGDVEKVLWERCGAEMFRMHAVWRCPNCRFKTDCCGW